jgi:hypothetical protein
MRFARVCHGAKYPSDAPHVNRNLIRGIEGIKVHLTFALVRGLADGRFEFHHYFAGVFPTSFIVFLLTSLLFVRGFSLDVLGFALFAFGRVCRKSA